MTSPRIDELLQAAAARARLDPDRAAAEMRTLIVFLAEMQRDTIAMLYETRTPPSVQTVASAARLVVVLSKVFDEPPDSTRGLHDAFYKDFFDGAAGGSGGKTS